MCRFGLPPKRRSNRWERRSSLALMASHQLHGISVNLRRHVVICYPVIVQLVSAKIWFNVFRCQFHQRLHHEHRLNYASPPSIILMINNSVLRPSSQSNKCCPNSVWQKPDVITIYFLQRTWLTQTIAHLCSKFIFCKSSARRRMSVALATASVSSR